MSLSPKLKAKTVRRYPSDWSETDTRAVDTVRLLAADAVQNCGSGHPGTAMSLAPLAYTLYQRVLNHNPADPQWAGRDRFVLSVGHSSLTQYIQLFLGGFGLELEDLQKLRTWGSLTPGHPEYGHTAGVEITTGPLGQGLASSVGMAMAARKERGLFDPDAPAGESPFDHYVYTICSDGDVQEGVTAEACSLAGTQQLGNLIVFWDDNNISIEDDTDIAFSESVAKRYEAYGWQVLEVGSGEDVAALEQAIKLAKQDTSRPTFIRVQTVIAYPAPNAMNTGASHGAALGEEEIRATKKFLGFDPDQHFHVDDKVLSHTRELVNRGTEAQQAWQRRFDAWAEKNPERKQLFDRMTAYELPENFGENMPVWEPDAKGIATRKASAEAIQVLAAQLPELWGGSADLAGSNNTVIKGAPSFGPQSISTDMWQADPLQGRNLHFGIREHGMAAIMNGIALHGHTRVYGGTFLIFSEYMYPAVRLGALMGTDTYYVWTHDSIGLGEDGPTHQPVETLAALRAIPNLSVIRPADANETTQAWVAAMRKEKGPKGLALTRQNVPVLDGTAEKAAEGVAKGAYVLVEASASPELILIATGSEVHLAVAAAQRLEAEGTPTRVVSAPCLEWFEQQDEAYRESVLPREVPARVSIEAGLAMPWHKYTAPYGRQVSLEHYGASAPAEELFEKFGFSVDNVVAEAKKALDQAPAASKVSGWGEKTTSGTASESLAPAHAVDSADADSALAELAAVGTATWLDDLSRERITSGNLKELIETKSVLGVTTNPSIFSAAMSKGDSYDADIAELAQKNPAADEAVYELAIADVQDACDVLSSVYERTGGADGRVSIEVDPRISADTDKTLEQARSLWQKVGRENAMIKIPATPEGLPAITAALAEGISVNVTLIFSVELYREVIQAYKEGIKQARDNGHDLSKIHSVASFFVSRIDTEVDNRLDEIGTDEARSLRGQAGIANARRAYALFIDEFQDFDIPGANKQRPLWASTGVKNPHYPADMYVTELAGPDTVNTMPEATLEAVLESGIIKGDTLTGAGDKAGAIFSQLESVGIDFAEVYAKLELEGIDKFVKAWEELLESMSQRLR